MAEEGSSKFITKRRSIGEGGELKWGGDNGEPWSEAMESSEGVTVTDDGTISSKNEIPDSVVEDFERSNPLDDYDGDTAVFGTITDALEGDTSLHSTEDTYNQIISTSGLSNYPQKGDEISALVQARQADSGPTILFGVADYSNFYENRVRVRDDLYQIIVRESGNTSVVAETTVSLSADQAYESVIEWHDGTGSESDNTIVATLHEFDATEMERGGQVATISGSDATFAAENGIGWATFGDSGSTESVYDYFVIWGGVK